jgi:glutamate carboxypeptidase
MLQQMVAINSFTGNREGVNRLGRLTAQLFAPLGFLAESVPSSNPLWGDHLVLSRPGAGGPTIAMIAHLDTVYSPEEEARNQFRWSREGDRIFGPGTDDMKGGSVMIWLVLEGLRHCFPEVFEAVTWKLFWNSSEEAYSPDFRTVCQERLGTDALAALVFEGENRKDTETLLVVARKGRATWRVNAAGRGAHAGSKHAFGANAIVQLTRTVQQIDAITDYSRDLTVTVGTVTGGTVLNRVPHLAQAEGEFRAFTPEAYALARNRILALNGTGDVRSPVDGFPCSIIAQILTESAPWPRNAGSDRLLGFWQRAGKDLGLSIHGELRGGLSDGNLLWDFVPTLDGLGPWGDNAHCSERSPDGSKLPEFVTVGSFAPKAALNILAIARLAATSITW